MIFAFRTFVTGKATVKCWEIQKKQSQDFKLYLLICTQLLVFMSILNFLAFELTCSLINNTSSKLFITTTNTGHDSFIF